MTEKIEEPNPQGKTTNPMDNQQETEEKILRVMTGALSVLSYPPLCSFHSSYLDLRDLGQWFLGQLGQ